jgi:hypothetical protein
VHAILQAPLFRAVVAIVVLLWALRLYSYARAERRRGGWWDFIRFMSFGIVTPYLVYTPCGFDSRIRCDVWREAGRVVVAITVIGMAWLGVWLLLMTDASKRSWLVNHLILLAGFVIIMTAFGQFSHGAWRLMGLRARPVVDNILLSRTPADFWRRWSWPIHLWLYRYVYLPTGGNRRPVLSVLVVFFASGVLHEVLVLAGLGRITGHQTLYFMISALGVLASPALERLASRGPSGNVLARAMTLSFLAITASLMFVTFHFLLPVYHHPGWLAW